MDIVSSSALVADANFLESCRSREDILPGVGRSRSMSLRGVLFCQKCMGALYSFVINEEEPSMEISVPFPIKARDPFLWISEEDGRHGGPREGKTKCPGYHE